MYFQSVNMLVMFSSKNNLQACLYSDVRFIISNNILDLFELLKCHIFFCFQGQSEFDIDEELPIHCGIAHTRWATHGEPSGVNSHPQRSDTSNGKPSAVLFVSHTTCRLLGDISLFLCFSSPLKAENNIITT